MEKKTLKTSLLFSLTLFVTLSAGVRGMARSVSPCTATLSRLESLEPLIEDLAQLLVHAQSLVAEDPFGDFVSRAAKQKAEDLHRTLLASGFTQLEIETIKKSIKDRVDALDVAETEEHKATSAEEKVDRAKERENFTVNFSPENSAFAKELGRNSFNHLEGAWYSGEGKSLIVKYRDPVEGDDPDGHPMALKIFDATTGVLIKHIQTRLTGVFPRFDVRRGQIVQAMFNQGYFAFIEDILKVPGVDFYLTNLNESRYVFDREDRNGHDYDRIVFPDKKSILTRHQDAYFNSVAKRISLTGETPDIEYHPPTKDLFEASLLSPDGKTVYVSYVNFISTFDADTGKFLGNFSGRKRMTMGNPLKITLSEDGKLLFAHPSADKFMAWSTEDGRELYSLSGQSSTPLMDFEVSAHGDHMVAVRKNGEDPDSPKVSFWVADKEGVFASNSDVLDGMLRAHEKVKHVSISPDGKTLVVSLKNGSIKLFRSNRLSKTP